MSSLVFLLPRVPRLGTEEADKLEIPVAQTQKAQQKPTLSGQKTGKGQPSRAEHF